MSVKNAIILTLALATQFPSYSFAIPQAEIGELQFHKIDQLVATKKINEGFISHLKGLRIKKDSATEFQVTFLQESDSSQIADMVTILATVEGKAKAFSEFRAPAATHPVNWNGAVPLDIFEKAVEYIVDTTADPRLIPFRDGLVSAEISPVLTPAGARANVIATAAPEEGTLILQLDLGGKVLDVNLQK